MSSIQSISIDPDSTKAKELPEPEGSLESAEPVFELFPRLPIEVRLMIWELNLPGPRLVDVYPCFPKNQDPHFYSTSSPPTNLHVCSESRQEALKIYRAAFELGESGKQAHVYFSPSLDTIFLGGCKLNYFVSYHSRICANANQDIASIQRLVMTDCDWNYNFQNVLRLDIKYLHHLTAIETISIVGRNRREYITRMGLGSDKVIELGPDMHVALSASWLSRIPGTVKDLLETFESRLKKNMPKSWKIPQLKIVSMGETSSEWKPKDEFYRRGDKRSVTDTVFFLRKDIKETKAKIVALEENCEAEKATLEKEAMKLEADLEKLFQERPEFRGKRSGA